MGEEFSEIGRIVRGYLNSRPSQSSALTVSRTVPAGQSEIREQSEWLKKEISMWVRTGDHKGITRPGKNVCRMSKTTGAEINAKNTQQKEQSQGGESATVENIVNNSVKRSEEQEQNGNLRIQSATPFQPCSSSISDSSTTVNSNGAAACFLPVVLCIHQLQLLPSFQCLTSLQCGTNPFTSSSHHWIPVWTLPRPH